jgi:hypothetical protein
MLASAATGVRAPTVITGRISHLRGISALLTGTVDPHESPTTFFFQYGPTTAYAYRTPSASAGSGSRPVKVGQFARPVAIGYHYRLVATNAAGTSFGRDFVLITRKAKLGIELFEPGGPTAFGHSVIVRGRIVGRGSAGRAIALQSSPWPYKELFENVGRPTVTNAAGLFSFSVGVLPISTQFRVITLDTLPKVSKILNQLIAVRVTLKMRQAGVPGFVRLYGTVSPVEVGARVEFQVQKPKRPNGRTEVKEERTFRFVTQATTVVKRATKRFSRFSLILNLRSTGRYRAWVLTRNGAIVPGGSHTIYLKAAAGHKR